MKNYTQLALTVLVCATMAACSEKVVTASPTAVPVAPVAPVVAPAAPAPATASVAIGEPSPAAQPAAPAVQAKEAALVCEDRKIELKAACVDLYGPESLACTSQTLTVSAAGGDKLGERIFKPQKGEGSDPATVEEKVGQMSCVRSKANEKYIVTSMANGGNCDECEWFEVYDWNGKQIGSTRTHGKNALVDELVGYASGDTAQVFGKSALDTFYSTSK